jgi:hypothetical protein
MCFGTRAAWGGREGRGLRAVLAATHRVRRLSCTKIGASRLSHDLHSQDALLARSNGAIRELLGLLFEADHQLCVDAFVSEEARRNLAVKALRGLAALEALLHVCNWERSPVSRTAHRCVLPERAEQSDFWRRFSPTRFKWILVYRANPAVLSGKAVRQGSNNQGEGVGSKLLSAFTCRSICGLSG